ncbi:unannotated protein [freshwater metagenome]|uniref:Unannotated protein n=1 Tax=freshwater metagenome TaxID=449393 RepID=A0A6J6LHA8_9ZZZZ
MSSLVMRTNTTQIKPAAARIPTLQKNAGWNPATKASGVGPGNLFVTMKAVVADAATVFKNAKPIDPPICWLVLSTAEATPASWLPTPNKATAESGTKIRPIPILVTIMPGKIFGQ